MAISLAKKRPIFNEINITPLTDIFLVLLIIMMVVAPMMHQMQREIKPPQVTGGTPVQQGKLTVEITRDAHYFIDGDEIPVDSLMSVLEAKVANIKDGDKNVVIRADKETRSGDVMKVFEAARDAHFEKVTIAGEKLSAERQQQLMDKAATSEASSTSAPASSSEFDSSLDMETH